VGDHTIGALRISHYRSIDNAEVKVGVAFVSCIQCHSATVPFGCSDTNYTRFIYIYIYIYIYDRFCGLVVRVRGCRTEMYCVSCEVRTEFIYVM
jgi:hypothetical protein